MPLASHVVHKNLFNIDTIEIGEFDQEYFDSQELDFEARASNGKELQEDNLDD